MITITARTGFAGPWQVSSAGEAIEIIRDATRYDPESRSSQFAAFIESVHAWDTTAEGVERLDCLGEPFGIGFEYSWLRSPAADMVGPISSDLEDVLTEAQADWLTRSNLERALTKSGEFGVPTQILRAAYVKHVMGRESGRRAYHGAAEVTRELFEEAWQRAHARHVAESEALASGEHISGLTLQRLRTLMGLSQPQLAEALGIGERTVRRWETPTQGISHDGNQQLQYRTINRGVAAEVWAMWDQWIEGLRQAATALKPAGEHTVRIPANTDPTLALQLTILTSIDRKRPVDAP